MPTFSLTKTYLDCQTENGETIVCYASLLSLGHLKFRHASWLELLPDGTSKRRQTFIRGAMPENTEQGNILWQCRSLHAAGTWRPEHPSLPLQHLHTERGLTTDWHCLQPRSRVSLRLENRHYEGIGYAERLHMTLPPWKLPIDTLHWGRILGEQATPVIQQAGWIYVSIYPVLLLVILLQHTDALMRSFAVSGILACALAFLLYILFPLSCPFLPFEPTTAGGRLLEWERSVDLNGGIAFPSYHALWAFLMLAALWRAAPGNLPRLLMLLWTLALCWSCVATGMHGWIDIIAAALLTAGVLLRAPILRSIIRLSECLANSWHAWRIGPLRIINHAIYTFLAAAGGYYLVLALAGPPYLLASGIVTICSLAGAGIWAQLIEGSSQLLRPFGYYGAILGGIAGILLIAATSPLLPENGNDPWIVFGAMAAAAPWIQAIGRIRCIVQGCCHGRPVHTCHTHLGLRHTNPSSRVCALSPYTGIPLHATPLYSIAFNLLIGTILLRLWTASASVALIAGLYFALAGLSRFVEEAYRENPKRAAHGDSPNTSGSPSPSSSPPSSSGASPEAPRPPLLPTG